jgi:hypothetical protein
LPAGDASGVRIVAQASVVSLRGSAIRAFICARS